MVWKFRHVRARYEWPGRLVESYIVYKENAVEITMRQRQPLSIRTSIWLAVAMTVASIILGTAALYGYQLYRGRQEAERLRVRTIAQTYAAQVAPQIWSGPRTAIVDSVEQLFWHPSLCLMAILDPDRRPLVVRGSDQLLNRYFEVPESTSKHHEAQTWNLPSHPQHPMPELNLAAVPIIPAGAQESQGTLVCAARPSSESILASQEVWVFFACLMFMAATGLLLGTSYLRLSVIEPLALLRSQTAKTQQQQTRAVLPTNRPDEIGDLAKLLSELYGDVEQWRHRTTRLQNSFARRVDSETARMTQELRRVQCKVWIDPLTKLGNRRLLNDKFADIFQAQRASGEDFAIAMIDVDNFKTLNDTLGHKAGDKLLQFVGELLRQCVRAEDLAVRVGGDEFMLLLPNTSSQNAKTIAERMIRLFAQQAILLDVDTKPAVSVGVASLLDHHPSSPEELIHMADQALYSAKRTGKSQVAVYADHPEPALVA